MIKAIFFDLDGVLTTDAKGSLTMSKNLCELVPGLSVQEVLDSYREDIEALNMGQISMSDVWKRMCAAFKIPANDDLLRKMMSKVPKNNAMFDLARSLFSRYRLGIITDNNRERMDLLTADMQLEKLFDPIVISATEHASKRDGTTTIFDAALSRAGYKAEEAIFIDNQEKNLEVPAQMGMKTYWHDDQKNDVAALSVALRHMGVDVAGVSLEH
ncbi:haloacid dehalogenase [Candidatus Peribacteria bacterium]|nr:haloacid dehalogenase [Candidatus Peribacteria bacterium]